MLDVRVKQGANVDHDHHMVAAAVRLKLRKTVSKRPAKSVVFLQLKNKFQAWAYMEDYTQSGLFDQ